MTLSPRPRPTRFAFINELVLVNAHRVRARAHANYADWVRSYRGEFETLQAEQRAHAELEHMRTHIERAAGMLAAHRHRTRLQELIRAAQAGEMREPLSQLIDPLDEAISRARRTSEFLNRHGGTSS